MSQKNVLRLSMLILIDLELAPPYAPSRKLIQLLSVVATSHNYMPFFKECPIPISFISISSISGISESTGLTLIL